MTNGFAFIDLFAGIGGLRQAMESIGGHCVFTSEWDKYARYTYEANYKDNRPIAGDIREVDADDVPEHTVLCAGFPCQPFSIAGVSKKNALGRKHGFECEAQGTLFHDVVRILKHRRPAAFLLENVKNLRSHDQGKTYAVILGALKELGYTVRDRSIGSALYWSAFLRIQDSLSIISDYRRRGLRLWPVCYILRTAPKCPSETIQLGKMRLSILSILSQIIFGSTFKVTQKSTSPQETDLALAL